MGLVIWPGSIGGISKLPEGSVKLHYTPGSPFARIIRVLTRELTLDSGEVEITGFPPSPGYFAINPLGQVPALEAKDGVRFPTSLIVDYVMSLPRQGQTALVGSVRRSED